MIHERDNAIDRHAITARKRLPGALAVSTVGHFLKKIPRATRFILFYGALVTAKVIDTHHRRSPVVQGGLEIPIEVKVTMSCNSENKEALEKFKEQLTLKHKEAGEDGKFEDITKEILEELFDDTGTEEE